MNALMLVRDLLWRGPLLVLLPAAGVLLTWKLRGLQLRGLPRALRLLAAGDDGGEGEVSPFQALCTA
ncbi:MAG: sodium:alanine symporter family protein, partial [Eubacteriales bacterium]|nr:sodium:alanine symporter family protein [Eubacteriales bacterium]